MRTLVGFVVLLAGVAAVSAHFAEPHRFKTDMSPLTGEADRLGGFATVADGARTLPELSPFQTTITERAATAQPASAPSGEAVAPITVPQEATALDAATREALARDIQSELARLGCYGGPLDGVWSSETQRAAGLFATEANARIAVSEPDFALFSLAKTATSDQACGPAIVAQAPAPITAPAMGLGGPGTERRAKPATSYRRDRSVEALFTNPLGR